MIRDHLLVLYLLSHFIYWLIVIDLNQLLIILIENQLLVFFRLRSPSLFIGLHPIECLIIHWLSDSLFRNSQSLRFLDFLIFSAKGDLVFIALLFDDFQLVSRLVRVKRRWNRFGFEIIFFSGLPSLTKQKSSDSIQQLVKLFSPTH